MSESAARSRCWAAASSAARSLRLLDEQADDLAARVGAPLELAGIAVRRPAHRATPTCPRDLFTTDAAGAGRPRRRRHRGRGDRRHRAGPVADPGRARARAVGRHRQQGAARRGRRDAVRRRRRRPAATSTTRPPWPARSRCCGRCASRWPATRSRRVLGIVNGTTNYILTRMDETGAGFAEALEEATGARLRRGRPDRRRRGLRRRGQGRDPRRRWRSTPGSPRPTSPRGHHRGHRRRRRAAPRRWAASVKLLAICERVRTGRHAVVGVRVHPAMIPRTHPLAARRARPTTRSSSRPRRPAQLMFYGRGAGGAPTASAVLGDLVAVARNRLSGARGAGRVGVRRPARCGRWARRSPATTSASTWPTRPACWRPSRTAFAEHDVSIQTVRQEGRGDDAHAGHRHAHAPRTPRCPRPSSTLRGLDVVRDVASVMRVEGDWHDGPSTATRQWRGVIEEYRDRLPVADATPVVTLREGGTPLRAGAGSCPSCTGCEVYLKVEGANPTGSFKDRGMTMAITKAVEEGAQAVICASTGNTCAVGGRLRRARRASTCAVLVPQGKIAHGQAGPGARARRAAAAGRRQLRRLPRPGPRAGRRATRSRWSTRVNPFRIEGQKTAAFEIVDALGDAPDVHCLPVGNAGNITAYWKGYTRVRRGRRRRARPAMCGFQAAGAAPIVTGAPVRDPETDRHRDPDRQPGVLGPGAGRPRRVRRPHRGGDRRADPRGATGCWPRSEGVFVEPASRGRVAGLLQAPRAGVLDAGQHGRRARSPATASRTRTGRSPARPTPVDRPGRRRRRPAAAASACGCSRSSRCRRCPRRAGAGRACPRPAPTSGPASTRSAWRSACTTTSSCRGRRRPGLTVDVAGEGAARCRATSGTWWCARCGRAFDALGGQPRGLEVRVRQPDPARPRARLVRRRDRRRRRAGAGAGRRRRGAARRRRGARAGQPSWRGIPTTSRACLLGGLTIAWMATAGARAVRLDVDAPVCAGGRSCPARRCRPRRPAGCCPRPCRTPTRLRNAGRAALLVAALGAAARRCCSPPPRTGCTSSYRRRRCRVARAGRRAARRGHAGRGLRRRPDRAGRSTTRPSCGGPRCRGVARLPVGSAGRGAARRRRGGRSALTSRPAGDRLGNEHDAGRSVRRIRRRRR